MDFTNPVFLTLAIVTLLVVLFILGMIVSFGVGSGLERRKNKSVSVKNRSYSIFIIDKRENSVTTFSLSDLANKQTMSLTSFYALAVESQVTKLKEWVDKISNNEVSPFLEIDVLNDNRKNSTRTLLKVVNYDKLTGKIILQSEHIASISNYETKKKTNKSDMGIVSRSDISSEFDTMKSIKGYTFAIRFSYLGNRVTVTDVAEQYLYTRLKYTICSFATHKRANRKILEVNTNELVLFDMQIASSDEAVQLAISIVDAIKKELRKDSNGSSIHFGVGIVQNAQYYHDFNSLLEKAEQVSIHAQQLTDCDYFLFDKSSRVVLQSENYIQNIDAILEGGHLSITYRPIVDCFNKRILGYFSYVNGSKVIFNNFNEIMKYSSKYGRSRELLDYIERQIVPVFSASDRTNGASLFVEASMFATDHIANVLSQIQTVNKIDLILLFDEQEVCDNASEIDLVVNKLKELHNLGYGLALSISDKTLLLDSKINNEFDYFVVKAVNIKTKERMNSITHSYYSIIASLQRYNKPIIVTDIPTRHFVDIIIQSGINLVSSDTNGPSSEMVMPISEKRMKELNDIAIVASRRV